MKLVTLHPYSIRFKY